MVSNTILYIALMSTGRLNVALTKDLLLTVRKLKSRSGSVEGIVFLEEFDSLRAAAARLVELRSLAPTELWTLVKDVNPQLSDLSGEFVPVAATFDSLSCLKATGSTASSTADGLYSSSPNLTGS